MFHHQSHELKQQDALDAARNPHSSVNAEDAERTVVEDTRGAGGAAYQFDPDASPEAKAAQARSDVPPGFFPNRKPTAAGLVSDADGGTTADYDLPPPTTAGAVALSSPNTDNDSALNVQIPEDPRWARDRTGWAPRFGNGDVADDEGPNMLEHQTWVESHLDEAWFGEWYYNAGVIIFACLATYVVTLLGGGLGWVFIVMATCSVYYRTSLRRVRRNFRDDVRRELAKEKLDADTESLEWMNSFLVKFWPILAPVICESVIKSVDQVLSTSTPAFLDSLRLRTFILGTKPPRMEHVKTHIKTEDDTILMDWKFSFNPNDTVDMTARQLKNKINPKVVLEIRVGKGVISKALDVIVEDMAFSGLMRVKVKLQIPYPYVEKAEISFLERPTIDYVCKPLGGDMFGFDMNVVPGLEGFILEQIHANIGPIMYAPNVFPIEIAKILAGNAVDQAIGVVHVTLHGAQGLKNPDKFPGVPDPYTTISINSRDVLNKSKTITQSSNPKWNETFNIIITSLNDSLTFQVYDWNEYRKDKELGTATFQLDRFTHDAVYENLQLPVMTGGKPRGIIQADIRFFPVLEAEKLPDGTVGPAPESNNGIAKFTVEQAKELDGTKSMVGHLNPYAVLLLNGKEVHISQKLTGTNNPVWPNATKEFLITDRKAAKLGLVIKDDRAVSADPIIGTYQIRLDDMLDLMRDGREWYNLSGTKTGQAKMLLQWKPVALKAGIAGSGGYVTPIGVMRLHLQSARDLRNLETVGKSDPYVRVLLSGIEKGRTVTSKSNLNPDFDEVIYVPVHSTSERLTLEVMDQEKTGADRSLGSVEVRMSEYIQQAAHGEYLPHETKAVRSEPLILGSKGAKGQLVFTCAFYPTYNVADPADEEEKETASTGSPGKSNMVKGTNGEVAHGTPNGAITSIKPEQAELDMQKKLDEDEKNQPETEEVKQLGPPKITISAEDLSSYECGLLVFKILDASLAHSNCQVEVVMDDMLFPSYRSSKAREKQYTFNETGDAMVREIDVSRITLRVRQNGGAKDDEDDKICGKLTGNTLDVLRRAYHKPLSLTLKGDDGRESLINVQLKYIPIKMRLDPSESINNMGTLRVDVLDAAELPAADRNGKSDPYCKFILEGKQVFKTQIQKKTLHPAWNEFFETPVKSRTAGRMKVECWDWDLAGEDDLLGSAEMKIDMLEPFVPQEVTLGLDGKSGAIRLKMLFKPEYVTRSHARTSTSSGTFATPGKVVGAPVKGVGKGAVLVGGNLAKGASFLGRGFRRRKTDSGGAEVEDSQEPPLPQTPALPSSSSPTPAPRIVVDDQQPSTPQHSRDRSYGDASTVAGVPGSGASIYSTADSGIASLSIVSASGYDESNIRVYVRQQTPKGMKDVHKTRTIKAIAGEVSWAGDSESFKVNYTPDTQLAIVVRNAHTFGGYDDLGEGTLSAEAALADGGGYKTVKCGPGVVVVKASVAAAEHDVNGGNTGTSPHQKRIRSFMPGRGTRVTSNPRDSGE